MNSCLYECSVRHHRLAPQVHSFEHGLFLFYLDLDEVDALSRNSRLFGRNRRSLYRFCEGDHEPGGAEPLKERVLQFLRQKGVEAGAGARVRLLTLPRVGGYIFNPISVFYCFDTAGRAVATVVEVGNTFREMKLYLLGREDLAGEETFEKTLPKDFYVSPFSALTDSLDFRLALPRETLALRIDDRSGAETMLISTLTGKHAALNDRSLAWFTVKYPLVTLKVIFLIHWHAFRLWLKGAPFIRKAADAPLQREVLRPHTSLIPKSK